MPQLKPLSANQLDTLRHDFDANKSNRMAMNAVTTAGINNVARNYDRARLLQRRFSTVVDNGEATHQDHSGRCWLFSSLNVARFVAKKNMNLKEFEFSQNYAMYFDKLERINYFMQDMAGLIRAGEPVDSRLFQHMLHDVMGDGGQWTMAMNIYKKYGAVPKSLFPETESSKNTSEMNTQLRRLLHTAVAHMQDNPNEIDDIIVAARRRDEELARMRANAQYAGEADPYKHDDEDETEDKIERLKHEDKDEYNEYDGDVVTVEELEDFDDDEDAVDGSDDDPVDPAELDPQSTIDGAQD